MDREAWDAAVYGVTKSQTRLSNWTELKIMLIFLNSNAAAAKSPQSCLTLYDSIDGSPPGSSPFPSPMHASMLSRFSHVWLCNKAIQIITSLWVSCGSFIRSVSDFGSFGFPSFSVLILLISFFIFIIFYFCLSLVQLLSRVLLFSTPWTAARQITLPIINSWSPPKPMSIELVMPSNHLILCCPLLLLPSTLPRIRVFSNESPLWCSPKHQVAKVLEFQLQHQSFQWTPRTSLL